MLDEVQHFTDGSVRRRACAGLTDFHLPCMCDAFKWPLGAEQIAGESSRCTWCGHLRERHAVDGCHETDVGFAWRPGPVRCSCDCYPGQRTFRRWKLDVSVQPHGRCERAGRCLEHDADPKVESCS